MNRNISIPLVICTLAIALFCWVAMIISSVWLFVPATVITFFVYMNSFYRQMPTPDQILPLYLLALGIQMLHFAEEYLAGFTTALPALLGQEPYPIDFWLGFNMFAYFIFTLGGIVLFRQWKAYSVIPLFFILVGVLFNAFAHLLLALYTGGYFPGLYTAILYLIIAPFVIKRTFKNTK